MAEFIYTTSTTVDRPVFIEADKLESLDKILDEEWQRLGEYNKKRLDARVEEELNDDYRRSYLSRLLDGETNPEEVKQRYVEELRERLRSSLRESRNITLYLKGKKTIVPSFSEALRQQALFDEEPVGFEVELRRGDIGCDIELKSGGWPRGGALSLRVSPEHLPEARELFASLQRWASSLRPPAWQRWWVILNPLQWILLGLMFVITGTYALESGGSKAALREHASQILKDGLTQDEQLKAVELMLSFQAELGPQGRAAPLPSWLLIVWVGGLVLSIILSITPKSIIGIGKGEEKIKRWRTWLRIVFFLVPGFIFAQILLPYLLRWLGVS